MPVTGFPSACIRDDDDGDDLSLSADDDSCTGGGLKSSAFKLFIIINRLLVHRREKVRRLRIRERERFHKNVRAEITILQAAL